MSPRHPTERGRRPVRTRPEAGGFTLIELMITVAIVAILAAIAYASYEWAVVKGRRSAAQGCLLELAQSMERHYTVNLSYTGAPNPAGSCVADLQPFYTFSFSGTPAGRTYTIQAAPTERQRDNSCGTLSVDQTGATSAGASDCW